MLAEIVASGIWSEILGYLKDAWFILLVLIGFSVIIFVHELGHFLMAKLVGIRVETFAIGFGPRLIGFKRGETDYCIRILPLGGYVKMMGQEDFALDQERVEATKIDPGSFLAKTPGQRALVVSGGVVMNVLFAALGFILVFMHGLEFPAPITGGVIPGSPAAAAGLQPGDRILTVNGEKILNFNELQLAVLTSNPNAGVDLELERDGKIVRTQVKPLENRKEELLQSGVAQAATLKVADPGMAGPDGSNLKENDIIVRVDSKTPKYYDDVEQALVKAAGKPVELTVERTVDGKTQQVKVQKRAYLILFPEQKEQPAETSMPSAHRISDIPQENASLLGLVPRRKFISAPDSQVNPSANADFVQPGDIVYRVGDIQNPTWKEIRDFLYQFRNTQAELEVIRGGAVRKVKLDVPWKEAKFEYLLGQLGFDDMNPVVSNVLPDSPSGKTGIPRNAKIVSCNDKKIDTWFDMVDCLKANAGQAVKLTYQANDKTSTAIMDIPEGSKWEENVAYAIDFWDFPELTTIKAKYPHQAFALGIRQTWYVIKSVYVTIQRVAFTRTIGVRQLSGPIYIIHRGKEVAEAGFHKLLYYMALISANLAVINFLPIPVVDGGLMLILLLEKIRGRSMSGRSTAIWQGVGLSLIIALFIFVTYNDIAKIIRGN